MITGKYPNLRLRRNRKQPWIRRLTQENMLSPDDFILPIFLIDGKNKKEKIKFRTSSKRPCSSVNLQNEKRLQEKYPLICDTEHYTVQTKDTKIDG